MMLSLRCLLYILVERGEIAHTVLEFSKNVHPGDNIWQLPVYGGI